MKPPVQYAMMPPRVDAPKVGKMKPVQQPKVAKMRGIDEALDYYLGPTGIPDKLRAVNQMFNPVETLGGSMRASQRLFAPETDGWGRVQAAGDMLSGVAGFVAPMVAAAKVGAPAVNGVVDAFTGISTAPATQAAKTTATDFALRDDGSVPLFGGGKSDPTATGWTFRDMRKPVLTGADEKRVQSMFDRVQWQETELPIGRMIATQPTVNPDFAETLSSQDLLPTVVQKGNELFVRDGHHRLVKAAEAGSTKAKVALLNLDPPTEAPLLDYRAPPPWSAEDDDLLAELMAPVAPMRPSFKAYHGSPHDFDKFSMDKIGTGEGAQAYGHGLYFAEQEGIAKSYRDALSFNRDGQSAIADAIATNGDSGAEAYAPQLAVMIEDAARAGKLDDLVAPLGFEDAFAAGVAEARKRSGSMYEVQINADPETFLDWDKPLSAQPPNVQRQFGYVSRPTPQEEVAAYELAKRESPGSIGDHPAVQDVYRRESGANAAERYFQRQVTGGGIDDAARIGLSEAGIPGIRYLDAGSRSAGDGSRNYVVFDDAMIEILRKYGIAGLMMGGAGMMQPNQAQAGQ